MRKSFLFLSFLLYLIIPFSLTSNTLNKNLADLTANKLFELGEYEKALDIYLSEIKKKKLSDYKKLETYLIISKIYWNLGNLNNSYKFVKKANNISKIINNDDLKKLSSNIIRIHELYQDGKTYRNQNDYIRSKQSFKKAIEIASLLNIDDYLVKCLRQLSITEYLNLNLQEFFLLNKKALDLAKKINNKKEICQCLNNIGIYYWKIDNYSKALSYFEEALEISKEKKLYSETSKCLNNISIIYKYLGEFDKSLTYIFNSLKLDAELKDNIGKSIDLNNIGVTYHNKALITKDKNDFTKAEEYYLQCLKLARIIDEKNLEIHVLNNLGALFNVQEKYFEALNYFNLALKKAEEIQNAEDKGFILNNIGIVYYNLGNYEESTKYYQQAIELALGLQRGEILWEAYLELAKANWKQGNLEEALANYKKSIDIIENIRSQINLEEYRARFLGTDKRIEAYHNLIELMVFLHQSHPEENYDAEAFYFLEKAKARAFLDSLELSKIHLARKINSQLENKEQELLKDISYLYTKILAASTSPEEKQHLQQELVAKEEELESLKREIRASDPAYASLQYPEIIKLHEAQQLLDKKTAFLLYCVDNDQGLGLLLTKKKLNIFSIPDREKLQKLTTNHLLEVTDRNNHTFSAAQKLHSFLIPSYISDNIENLIIIPDDVLLRIPFETLINPKSKKWLIQDFTISYSPSVSSLREIILRRKMNGYKTTKDILAVGDPQFNLGESKEDNGQSPIQSFFSTANINFSPLKYSPLEVKKINNIFKKKSEVYTQAQAKEENIKSLNLSNYKIIHFATHSVIDDKVPARSAIILSLDDDPNEDGFLQMREIYNLHLKADLVTLSACETGLGEFIRGEGIEGINRAFFYAGASAVLMSLWAVNDQATYQLMERFYYHLKNSLPLAKALRKAKLELINSDVLTHPYYWAGFIISGQANKSIFTHSKIKWILVTISGLLLGSAIFISIKRKNGHLKPSH